MSVKITIEGDGLSFSSDVEIVKAAQIIAFVKVESSPERERHISLLGNAVSTAASTPGLALTQSRAKTNAQKIAVLGKYICERDQQSTFSAKEVQEVMKKAGVPLPRNFARDIKDAVRANYIYENDDNQYGLTETGIQSVDDKFANGDEPMATIPRKKRNGSGGKRVIDDKLKSITIQPNGKGNIPDYWKITNKGQRVLWILECAQQNNIDKLTTSEIEYVATQLRDRIEAKNVTSLTTGLFKKGFLAATKGKYRILEPGSNFLKTWKSNAEE